MFLVFDIDDVFGGAASSFLLFLRFILISLGIGLPILYFDQGGIGAIIGLVFGLALGNLIYSIVTILTAKKILKQKSGISKRIIDATKLYLFLFVILTVIGYLFPIGFNISTFRLDCKPVFSMLIVTLLLNTLYSFWIETTFFDKSGIVNKIKTCISDFFVNLRRMALQVFIPLLVCYFILILFNMFTLDQAWIKDLYNSLMDKGNVVCSFEDTKYDVKRSQYASINDFFEKTIIDMKTNSFQDKEIKEKMVGNTIFDRKKMEHYWNDINNVNQFVFMYMYSLNPKYPAFDEYGIRIEDVAIVDLDRIYVHYYDLKYLKDEYLELDLTNAKVINEIKYQKLYMQNYHNIRELK